MALVPELAAAPVLGERVGLRPARHGGPRVAVVPGDAPGRRLVHAYGHGGAGVTLVWGCAAEVTRLALDDAESPATLRPAQRSTRNASRYAQ